MSYPSYDLDGYKTQQLVDEIARRTKRNKEGWCWYCDRALGHGKPCRKIEVHKGEEV